MRAAVDGRDTLALMPTGSGKSLTYQLAAMLRPTPTLVLSPLIALMKDQVDKLPQEVAAQSTLINSSLGPDEAAARLRGVAEGRYRMLYVAPERLRQAASSRRSRGIDVGLVVIDEVHCVSMWGHDFRPDYLFIRRALDALGRAGRDPRHDRDRHAGDRAEIATALGREPEIVRTSVVRPNLRYDVELVDGEEARLRDARRAGCTSCAAPRRSSTRARAAAARRLARTLRVHDLAAVHYHAGLEPEERSAAQEAFIEGRIQTVVATTAFGMGIDKPDIRLVALYNYPESLESYVQMVGRAGRDGRAVRHAPAREPRRLAASCAGSRARTSRPSTTSARSTRACAVAARSTPEELGDEPDPRVLVGHARAGRARPARLRRGPGDADRGTRPAGRRRRADRRAARALRAGGAGARRPARRLRRVASSAGTGRSPSTSARRCRRTAACATSAPPLAVDGRASRPRPHRCRTTSRGAIHRAVLEPALAARPDGPRGDAARLDERAPLGPALAPLRPARLAPRRPRSSAGSSCSRPPERSRRSRATTASGSCGRSPEPSCRGSACRDRCAAGPADEGLFERLRAWRLERARVDEVPAYVVLHDATLRELATAKPASELDLAAVKGFGPTKLERYGERRARRDRRRVALDRS